MMNTYQHSGAVTLPGVLLSVVLGLITALVVGVIYTFGVVYIPIIYVNILLTCALGACVGFVVGLGSRWGRMRNVLVTTALGGMLGLAAWYFAWAADPLARLPDDLDPTVAFLKNFLFDPLLLWEYVQIFYAEGFWGMSDNATVSGIPLAIVWVIEAGLIIFCAGAVAKWTLGEVPFCERCHQWTRDEADVRRLLVTDATLVDQFSEGHLPALAQFPLAPADAVAYLKLDLATCGTCAESNFLRASIVSTSVDKKGNIQTNTAVLIPYALLKSEQIPLVRQAGREMTAAESASWRGETLVDAEVLEGDRNKG